MSKLLRCCALVASAFLPLHASAEQIPPPQPDAKAWLVIDHESGAVLAQSRPDDAVEPASLTKLMTAYLTFKSLKNGQLKPDQVIPVSVAAWKTGGSKMFIAPDKPVTVNELIRGMIIQSGNDACVALAEAIAGSEAAFAQMMNAEAKRLGMTGTTYRNATGLTEEGHTTTARDLALLARALITDFPEYYPLYSTLDYTYNGIKQGNRNRLLTMDRSVDGMKTGHTDAAGWCLVSSAKRDGRRIVSVLLGAPNEKGRIESSATLLNYGYNAWENARVALAEEVLAAPAVYKGSAGSVQLGVAHDVVLTLPRGQGGKVSRDIVLQSPVIAPVAAGQALGTMKVSIDGKPAGEYPLVAKVAVEEGGFFRRAWDQIRLWLGL
ncbi:D-alanyl-D-alanine carboxypeptidase family protein [Methyloversatilis thermotolerans]|uniref:D-alanyl-D-alanine carboxypeptidase family protein n=1 Tax=Methyloversatilis thermotolerans TaxID=1346290 RepID=UPI00037E1A9E|nr:D-alanyl-D-alanine carboxypeptidase family protein [Methyloversatilis thermotolerans]